MRRIRRALYFLCGHPHSEVDGLNGDKFEAVVRRFNDDKKHFEVIGAQARMVALAAIYDRHLMQKTNNKQFAEAFAEYAKDPAVKGDVIHMIEAQAKVQVPTLICEEFV